ncbi:hypothetical protein CYMTET_40760 [Cymbomonas tetramitiformis]|uniref:Uncharacterized protein n=1 Tax=Cymbomonas tetramitiformis TaxID=36881 RepID=A0AAE0F2M3_9CHLO|nr:hypothetical protein CYMTET_40760 [Cymbomonas tetramitiformis]
MSWGMLGQNFNVAGVTIFMSTLAGRRYLAIPHISVQDINQVDWKALREAGFKGCVFDKDNTLTLPYAAAVHAPVLRSLEECKAAFPERVVMLSNSAGLEQFDPDGSKAEALEKQLNIPVLRHKSKKPGGGPEALEAFFECEARQLIMIGDRYFTDVVYGNRNGMLTIRPAPFTTEGESTVIKTVRMFEDHKIRRWTGRGIQAPVHNMLPNSEALGIDWTKDE